MLSDTPRADVAGKKMLPVRAPGALWTRPKIATFVVFGRSEVKISGNVAYDDRIIGIGTYEHIFLIQSNLTWELFFFSRNVRTKPLWTR